MKVFILTLLVLNSLCFVLGGEEEKNDFIDLDADEGEVPLSDDSVEDEEQTVSCTRSLNLCLIEIFI